MIFLGISKSNSRQSETQALIRGPLFPRTLWRWCRAGGGACDGAAQPFPEPTRPQVLAAGAQSPARFFPSSRPLSSASALRPSRRRAPPPAAHSADPQRSAALGLGPGPGAVLPAGTGPSLTLWELLSRKGPGRKGKRLVQRLPGLLGRPEQGCGGQISSVSQALFPGRSARL